MAATTYTAKFNGQVIDTRSSKTVTYTHAAIIRLNGELVVARWSKSAKAAAAKLPNGWEAARVATVTVEAPAAKLPKGVTVAANGVLSGPVKVLKSMMVAGTATMTEAGDLVQA